MEENKNKPDENNIIQSDTLDSVNSKDGQQSEQIINIEQPIKKFIGLITIISFITSVGYLFAYWFTFGVNVFEFIDISNIIAHSVFPLLIGLVCSLISFVFYYSLITYIKDLISSIKKLIPNIENLISSITFEHQVKFFVAIVVIMFVISVVMTFFYYIFTISIPPFIAYFAACYFTTRTDLGKEHIPKTMVRILLFFFIIFLPLEGAAYGRIKAKSIKRGDIYLYVDEISVNEKVRKLSDDKVRYIGKLGDYFFFLLPSDKSIYIASKEEIKPFVLKRFDAWEGKEKDKVLRYFRKLFIG
jgi:ABC-type multidrug transport system fused ATPase/permease subunit